MNVQQIEICLVELEVPVSNSDLTPCVAVLGQESNEENSDTRFKRSLMSKSKASDLHRLKRIAERKIGSPLEIIPSFAP